MNIFKKQKIGRLEYFLWNLAILPFSILNSYIFLAFFLARFFSIFSKENFTQIFFEILAEMFFGINFLNYFSMEFLFLFFGIYFIFYCLFRIFLIIKRLNDIGWSTKLTFIFFTFLDFILFFVPGKNTEKNILKSEENTKKLDF